MFFRDAGKAPSGTILRATSAKSDLVRFMFIIVFIIVAGEINRHLREKSYCELNYKEYRVGLTKRRDSIMRPQRPNNDTAGVDL